MSTRTLMIVILALVFGISAAVGVNSLRNQAPAAPPPETVQIVVAAVDVPAFAVITPSQVEVRECPKDLAPAGTIAKIDDVLDRAVLNPLVKGEVLLEGKLAPRGSGRGMAAKIPKGMRAFTINTPTVEAGVAGFVLPGNRVDVLLTVESGDKDQTGGSTTVTLLQNVEILAIEQRVVAPADSKVDLKELKSVTVLVTPEGAAKLNLGQSKGKLYLSLRSLNDPDHVLTQPVHSSQLTGEKPRVEPIKPPPVVVVEPPTPLQIRTLRGSFEGAVQVDSGSPKAGGR